MSQPLREGVESQILYILENTKMRPSTMRRGGILAIIHPREHKERPSTMRMGGILAIIHHKEHKDET